MTTRARQMVRHPDSERPTVEMDPRLLRNKLRDIELAEGTPVSGIPVITRPTMPTTDLDPALLRGLLVEETAVLEEAPVSRASFGLIEVEVVPPDHEDHEDEAPALPEPPKVELSTSIVAQLPDANERPAYWRESFKPEPKPEPVVRDAVRTQQVAPLPVDPAVMAYLRAPSGTAVASATKRAWQLPALTGLGGVVLGILSTIALYSF